MARAVGAPRASRTTRWRRVVGVLACIGALVVPGGIAAAYAAGGTSGDSSRTTRITELEELLGELSADEAQALRELETVRSAREQLDGELAQLATDIAAAEQRLADVEHELDVLTAQYLDFDRQLTDTETELRAAQERFAAAAVALYQSGGSTGRAAGMLVLEADSPMLVEVGTTYLAQVSGDRRDAVRELDDLSAAFEELLDATESSREARRAARAEAAEERATLDVLRADEESKRNTVAEQEALEAEIVASIQSQQASYEAELASLRATSNAISEMLRQRQTGQTLASGFSVARPVPGVITSGFGVRVHPILGSTRMHNGIDMAGALGSTISAAAPGEVVWAGARNGYGNTVIVDHGNQYATLYAHMSQIWVDVGDVVASGTALGAVGATGLATGPHLHFEIRLLGVPTNPLDHMA